jgi:arylsulfatase A-like enzyme
MKRPNILFILADQHRFCDLGCAGNDELNTPNLDALAREGARFRRAYSNCPVCVPARGTLLTGLHPLRHGAVANDVPVKAGAPSVAHALKRGGYDTAYIGKWHLAGVPRDQFIEKERRLGFDFWRVSNCNHDYLNYYYDDENDARHYVAGYEPVVQTELALEYLDEREGAERPWALYLSYATPHPPYLRMPEEMADAARARAPKLKLRGNVTEFTDGDFVPPPGHHAYPLDPGKKRWQPRYDSIEQLREMIAGAYGHIEALDQQIGRILDRLRETGRLDDTIVVYTSDHGDLLGSHGMCDKQTFYQESAHIPFIARWPGRIPAGSRDQLLGIADMAPTILGLVGLALPGEIDGRDLSACLGNPAAPGSEYLYFYNLVPAHNAWLRRHSVWHAVADGRYVYAAGEGGAPIALYDLECDPLEQNNLLGASPEAQARLSAALSDAVAENDGFLPWQTLLYRAGLSDLWDESQLHFGFPPIEERFKG